MPPKVSIITVVRNGERTIGQCMDSVLAQRVPSLEYIIIDGASTDETLKIVSEKRTDQVIVVSERDRGIYDAMNKGIRMATGDIIGILNSDDMYCDDHVIGKVVHFFNTKPIDALFADLVYVRPDNSDKIVRYYRGAGFAPSRFASGCMPPHPTFFVRRECYERYGLFKTDYKIAADFELLARFFVKHRIRYYYLPEVIIKMRTGGVSTRNLQSTIILNREILMACTENGIKTNMVKIYSKYLRKCTQLVLRPS